MTFSRIFSGIPQIASAMLPVMAPIVSLSPPTEMALRIASSKLVDSKNSVTFAFESRNGAVVARWAHNPEVVGSNPASATK